MISVSAGADVYHPSLAYLLAASGGMLAVWVGGYIEKKLRVDDAVGAVAVHGSAASTASSSSASSPAATRTGLNNVPSSFGGQLMGMLAFFPLAFLPGYIVSWLLKKANLLRVPPRSSWRASTWRSSSRTSSPSSSVPEVIVLPTGEEVEAGPILLDAFSQANGHRAGEPARKR